MNRNIMKLIGCIALILFATTSLTMAADQAIVSGTLEQADAGFVIKAEDGDYMLKLGEGQDVSTLVGKQVKALGKVEQTDAGKTLTVNTIAADE